MNNINKNMKIIFLPVYKWVFILFGLLLAAFFIMIVALSSIYSQEPFAESVKDVLFFLPIFALAIYLLLKPSLPAADGLSVMEIKDSLLSMIIYDKDKTKHTLQIPLRDIELFKVRVDNDNGPYEAGASHVSLTIHSKDGQKYNYCYDVKYYYKIQQLVSVARFFPNFKYEVNAKFDIIETMLLNYAKTGKDLGPINMFRLLFKSKNVSKTDKVYFRVYLIIIIMIIIYHISRFFRKNYTGRQVFLISVFS